MLEGDSEGQHSTLRAPRTTSEGSWGWGEGRNASPTDTVGGVKQRDVCPKFPCRIMSVERIIPHSTMDRELGG